MADAPAKRPAALTKLIDALAHLYVDVDSSRVVVDRAGIDATSIAFDARAIVNWKNITDEAIRQKAICALLTAADEMYPNVPELKTGLRECAQWTAQFAEPEALEQMTAQPAPRLWERSRLRIIGWTLIALGSFGVIGIVARESQHSFYGLPASHGHDILSDPEEWAFDGLKFFGRTLMVLVEYLTLNPIGLFASLIAIALVVYAIVRWQKRIARAWKPLLVVPLLVILAMAKALWYDVPTLNLDNVLKTHSVDMASFDIPPLFAPRARAVWREVVCARIANSGGEDARAICGTRPARLHLQKLDGRFLLDVLFTIVLCSIGVRVIRKLLRPSRELAWNLPMLWRRTSVSAAAVALLIAVLGVPWAYSRTVRRMDPPEVCVGDDCYFRICVDEDECYAYILPDEIAPAEAIPAGARITTEQDVLESAFEEQLQSLDVDPQDRASRFP